MDNETIESVLFRPTIHTMNVEIMSLSHDPPQMANMSDAKVLYNNLGFEYIMFLYNNYIIYTLILDSFIYINIARCGLCGSSLGC